MSPRPGAPRASAWEDAVLAVVAQVPPGRVLTYGDVAELLGHGSARGVGQSMARAGDEVCWWRVVRADGGLHEPLRARAAVEHGREGTPRRPDGRVDLGRARWDAAGLDLPSAPPG